MRDWGESLRQWLPEGTVRFDRPLREDTTFRIGGCARLSVGVHAKDHLIEVVHQAIREGFPWFLLGGGSNVLFSARGFDGVVILNRLDDLRLTSQDRIETGAGLPLIDFVRFAEKNGLSGAEDLAGIPGSVGGAIVGNAGAFGRNIGEILEYVDLISEDGTVSRMVPDDLEFDYRESKLKYSQDVVISAGFKLTQGNPPLIEKRIEEILALRAGKHPAKGVATAGSFFKNLPPEKPGDRRVAAGLILDRAGAIGLSVGDAAVFEKHANIVVNRGAATAKEVLELTAIMKRIAFESAGVALEEEVRRIGFTEDELAATEIVRAGNR
ncbi:MAG: UDP-N-acetylmuramate dehydrogenase [Candidatus Omnitrophica bacterium]|nr:UDP-N-acetylmuramate dehydrogenase [Candidatus Omnitrophota bacterium]